MTSVLNDSSDNVEEAGLSFKEVRTFKICMLFVMAGICFMGVIPYKVACCRKNESVLSYLNCFSAGIFLAMALIGLLPESVEEYLDWAEEKEIDEPFPLPYVCFFLGYAVVLLIDRVFAH